MNKKTKLLLRMGFKTFRQNINQFIALILIAIISVTIFIGLAANALTFQDKVKYSYDKSNFADLIVTLNPQEKPKARDEQKIIEYLNDEGTYEKRFYSYANLNSFNALFAVSEKYPTISKETRFLDISDKQTDEDFFVIDRNITQRFAINKLSEGTDLGVGDIAKVTLDLSLFNLNDYIINYLDAYLNEGKANPFREGKVELNFEITAIMESAENIVHTTINPYVFFCSNSKFRKEIINILKDRFTEEGASLIYQMGFHDFLGWGDGDINSESNANFPYPNQYLIKLNDPSKNTELKEVIKEYFTKTSTALYSIQTKEETTNYTTISTDASQAMMMSYIFPLVFFMVSILIIIASLRQVTTKDRGQIATLKALGFKNYEIYIYYFNIFGLLILFSSIIGSIVGPLVIPNILNVKYKALYTLPEHVYTYPVLFTVLTLILFTLITNLITFIAVRRVATLTVSEALRPKINKIRHRKVKEITNFKKRNSIYLSLKISIRDITKDLVKTFMIILGVLGCVMLLVAGFGIEDMGGYGVKNDSFINSGADYTLTYLDEVSKDKTDSELNIKKDDNQIILGYQPYSVLSTQIYFNDGSYETNLNIVGPTVTFTNEAIKSHYKYDLPQDKIIISEKIVEIFDVKKGDYLEFTYQGNKIKAQVYDIVYEFYTNGIYIPYSSTLFKAEVSKYKNAWVDVNENIDSKIVLDSLHNLGYVAGIMSYQDNLDLAELVISLLTSMTNAIKFFAIALAIVVMLNISFMNFNEKIREIATLKVLGFKRREISFSLISTILITSLVGSILGLLLGKPFMKLVLYINRVQAVCFNDYISFKSYLISFIITYGICVIVNILLALRTNSVKMVESLKSVE